MSSTVTNYIQPLTQPLEGLHASFTQLASQHRDMNDRLRSHKDDLLSNASFTFQGSGATAFAGMVDYYLDTSEKHMQAFDDAADAVRICHSTISISSNNADSAGLHEGLTNQVLSQVSHNDIIQRGSDPIQAVISDMQRTLSDMSGTAGDMFTNLLHFHFGTAYDDLLKEEGDAKRLAGDLWNLLQDIWRVLSQWATDVWSAVSKCLSAIWSAAQNVVKFLAPAWSWITNAISVAAEFAKSEVDTLGKDAGEILPKIAEDLDKAGKVLPFIGTLLNWVDGTDNTWEKKFSDLIGAGLGLLDGVAEVAFVFGVISDVFQLLGGAQQNWIAPWIAGNNTALEKELNEPGGDLSTDAQKIDLGTMLSDLGDAAYNYGHSLILADVFDEYDPSQAAAFAGGADLKKAGGDAASVLLSVAEVPVDTVASASDDINALTGNKAAIVSTNQQLEGYRSDIESFRNWYTSLI